MDADIIKRYSAPVPRYTSYPTAPHFSAAVNHDTYASWLAALPANERLSLYVHIPFCDTLCWYCGCNTKAVRRHAPVAAYLVPLLTEIETVAAKLGTVHDVAHMHWGGGSPNVLTPPDIKSLTGLVKQHFRMAPGAEFAVEIDPRHLPIERVKAFAEAGVNRISFGVQDFNPKVQAAINRLQSFEITKAAADAFRAHGVKALNIDLVYGLPHQTTESVEETLQQVLELEPERIAIFGYAHLPARLTHQRMIPDESLPDASARFEQSNRLAERLMASGFVRIGLDHFARRSDAMASKPINRNFQGYTTDAADTLIGFGASAIGKLPQGFVQNAVLAPEYGRRVAEHGLATVRGIELTDEDRIRSFVIERLMCDLAFSSAELKRKFGAAANPVVSEAEALLVSDPDQLVERSADGFRLTERGRPFVRTIAARFDTYLSAGKATHSSGV